MRVPRQPLDRRRVRATNRCIAYHRETGERCPRRVSIRRQLQVLKLCREHGNNLLNAYFAYELPAAQRDALASSHWNNARELGR